MAGILTEEQVMLRKAIRSFAEKEIAPLAEEAENLKKFPRELFPQLGDLGYLCVNFPAKYGGGEAGVVSECIIFEEIARINAGISSTIMIQSGIGTTIILEHGSEAQKQKYIVPAVKGQIISAFALTEPNAGSDVAALETRAQKEGDSYVINGTKMFITNGPFCDFVLVAAWTDKSQRPGKGISVFVVEKNTPGFTVARKLEKVGFHSSETGELVFDNCRIPKENLIGEEGRGFGYLMGSLTHGRITHAASSLGIAQAAFEAALQYAKERVQFGKPIGKNQVIAFKLARMAMEIEAARLIVYHAANLYDLGSNCLKEAAMAKLKASETTMWVAGEAMHIHGGYGYMEEYPVQRYWRDAKLRLITEGTSEIQQLVISRELGL
jgi:alkylation response protein AidB-like acyl-CoA dehydrogenase